ncbi:hypothetical protein K7Y63_004156 [Serratia marcescens]
MMKMIRNKVGYEALLNKCIQHGAGRKVMFQTVNEMVDRFGRLGGTVAYNLLNDALDRELPHETEDVVLDMLDALSGQCNPVCYIGTGDYHSTAQVA